MNVFIVSINLLGLYFLFRFYGSLSKQQNEHGEYVTVTRLPFLYFVLLASMLLING